MLGIIRGGLLMTALLVVSLAALSARGEGLMKVAALETEMTTHSPAPSDDSLPPDKETDIALPPIVWKPRIAGAPGGRVGGAVRGSSDLATPLVLAPGNLAMTVKAAPSLFWHLDAAAPESVKILFTLIDTNAEAPLVEVELESPPGAGVQRVRLAEYAVELETGRSYAWSIALVPDMENRAKDRVSQGLIQRVLVSGKPPFEAQEFAARGLWYDALESLSDAVDAGPDQSEALARRRSLLTQAGIVMGAD